MDSMENVKKMDLRRFIKEANNAFQIFKTNIDEGLNITLGNVSCDMDSCIGAILLGYYLTMKNDYRSQPGNFDLFWLPVINCPRKELCARIDIWHHLNKYEIDFNMLIFIDDLDINHYSKNNLLKLAIVDHNILDITQQHWGPCVTMIVDHHADEKAYLDQKHDRTITFCGSACSLIIEMIFRDKYEKYLTPEIFNFFLPAVLLDTENFKPSLEGTKWSQIDKDVIFNVSKFIMSSYYNELLDKKTDKVLNIQLGLDLILRKDYKNYVWKKCITGISVVFNPLHEILFTFGVEFLKERLRHRMKECGLNFYAIISQTYLKTGEPYRELMMFDEDQDRLNLVKKEWAGSKIKSVLKKFTGLKDNFLFYSLSDGAVSRKRLEPVLHEIFDALTV